MLAPVSGSTHSSSRHNERIPLSLFFAYQQTKNSSNHFHKTKKINTKEEKSKRKTIFPESNRFSKSKKASEGEPKRKMEEERYSNRDNQSLPHRTCWASVAGIQCREWELRFESAADNKQFHGTFLACFFCTPAKGGRAPRTERLIEEKPNDKKRVGKQKACCFQPKNISCSL